MVVVEDEWRELVNVWWRRESGASHGEIGWEDGGGKVHFQCDYGVCNNFIPGFSGRTEPLLLTVVFMRIHESIKFTQSIG